jgi:hypothetical protein
MYLGHGYYITSDKYQYIVEKRSILKTGKNAGEEIGRGASFHPTVQAACNWVLRQLQRGDIELKDEPEEAVELFQKRLEEVREMFAKCEHLEMKKEEKDEELREQH